jgi:type IV pilus assembly protein PilA
MGNANTPTDTQGNYVSQLAVANGVITVTYSSGTPQRANNKVNGSTITLVPYTSVDQSVSWKCRAAGSTAVPGTGTLLGFGSTQVAVNVVGTVLAKYAPAECRA